MINWSSHKLYLRRCLIEQCHPPDLREAEVQKEVIRLVGFMQITKIGDTFVLLEFKSEVLARNLLEGEGTIWKEVLMGSTLRRIRINRLGNPLYSQQEKVFRR